MRNIRVLLLGAICVLLALILGSCTVLTHAPATVARSAMNTLGSLWPAQGLEGQLRNARVDPFDTEHPAMANMDPALRAAVRQAAEAAHKSGIEDFWVTSGWRSGAYQQDLLDQAIAKYASVQEASKWVATPQTSSHVSGTAVDVGPTDAADWLSRKGHRFGLCQSYANEMWHYELSADAQGNCPDMRPSAAQ